MPIILSCFVVAATLVWWGVRLTSSGLEVVTLFLGTGAWPWSWACTFVVRLNCLACDCQAALGDMWTRMPTSSTP